MEWERGTRGGGYPCGRVTGMSDVVIGAGAEPVTSSRGRSRFAPITRQAGFFTGIGLVSSVANAALYLLLRQWWNVETSTVVAVTATTLISTEANRRMTFAEARSSRAGLLVQTLLVILFYSTYNTATLWVLHQIVTTPSVRTESLALLIASTAGGTARFVLLRAWVFRGRDTPVRAQPMSPSNELIGRERDDDERQPRLEPRAQRCCLHHLVHH